MISLSDLEDIFASGGKLSRRLPSYENRPDQLSMAEDVARCYNENRKGVIEAGTGIGKSYAYLAVALLNAQENSEAMSLFSSSSSTRTCRHLRVLLISTSHMRCCLAATDMSVSRKC